MTPRWERRMPARRRMAKSCSRNWTGMSRRRASSPIGTGPVAADAAELGQRAQRVGGLGGDRDHATPAHRMAAVGRFGPPLALMALIFALSAQPDLNSGLGGWDTVLRKLAHMTEFGAAVVPVVAGAAATGPGRRRRDRARLRGQPTSSTRPSSTGRHGSPSTSRSTRPASALAVLAWWRYSQPRSVAMRTAWARSTAPSLP